MQIPKKPLFFYCDLPPRSVTDDEYFAVEGWLRENDYPHGYEDTQDFLQMSFMAAYSPTKRFPLPLPETQIMVIGPGVALTFAWRGKGQVELREEYKS